MVLVFCTLAALFMHLCIVRAACIECKAFEDLKPEELLHYLCGENV